MEPTIGVLYVHSQGVAGPLLDRLQQADGRLAVHRNRAETTSGGLAVDCVLLDAPDGTAIEAGVETARAAYGPLPVIVRTEPGVVVTSEAPRAVIGVEDDGDLEALLDAIVTAGADHLVPEGVTLRDDVLASVPIGVTIADLRRPDNPLIYVNDHFERLTGYPETEILGRNCRFLQGRDTESAPVETMREAIDAGEPAVVTLQNYRRDGTPFWNRVELIPVREADGTLTHFLGFQRDVTTARRREAAEERIQEARPELLGLRGLDLDADQAVRRALDLGRTALDVSTATVLTIDDSADPAILLQVGTALEELGADRSELDALARRVAEAGDAWGFGEAAGAPTGSGSLECFLGAPVHLDGATWGVVCFLDAHPRLADFSEAERTFLGTLGSVIGLLLERTPPAEWPG